MKLSSVGPLGSVQVLFGLIESLKTFHKKQMTTQHSIISLKTMKSFITAIFWSLPILTQASVPAPDQALKLALQEPLTYWGQYIPSYSSSHTIPVCVYRNSKVLVKYRYCVSRAVPAVGLRVHFLDHSRRTLEIYAESSQDVDVSSKTRSQYFDDLFYLAMNEDALDVASLSSVAEYQKLDEAEVGSKSYGCVTGGTLRDQPHRTLCESQFSKELKNWTEAAWPFWQSPSADWYELLKLLKGRTIQDLTF
jgi:hypothetical protein